MGWVTLTERKMCLVSDINETELEIITLSRETRQIQRRLSYEQTVINNDKSQELRAAKEAYDAVKDNKPEGGVQSADYANWQQDYEDAKEEYEYQKMIINEYYDDELSQLEEEATDKETAIEEQKTTLEANLEAMRQELSAIDETISSDIETQTISLK